MSAMMPLAVRLRTEYPLSYLELGAHGPGRRRVGEQQRCRCFSCLFAMGSTSRLIPTDHVSPISSPQRLKQSTVLASSWAIASSVTDAPASIDRFEITDDKATPSRLCRFARPSVSTERQSGAELIALRCQHVEDLATISPSSA